MDPLRSVAGRLFLSYLAVVVVGLVVAGLAIGGLLFTYENDVTRVRLQELAAPFQTAVQTAVRSGQQPRDAIAALAEQVQAADARLLIVSPGNNPTPNNAQRRVLIDSGGTLVGLRLPPTDARGIGQFTDPDRTVWIFVQQQLRVAALGAGGQGFIVVARPRAVFADVARALLPSLVIAGIIAAGFALVVAGLLARTITQPLRRLVGGVRTFASDQRARVPVGGPTEVRELGSAFNEMAAEIERARASEQSFLADISHELRTPLTSIHGFAQAIAEGEARGEGVPRAAEIIQREARRLVRMVEGLLQVAKLEAGVQLLAHERIAAADLLRGAVAALDVQAREAGVSFAVMADALPVVGDPDRLSQLFINVLDNAVKHSPRGATVTVNGERTASEVVVRVRDQGTGLPAGTERKLFARFWRGDNAAARAGAGLGLAIAQAIAQAHGGSIDARNAPGGGAEFAIHLPAAA
ncbi:MAG TPA: HAMP domain-containing sensor histidine kinase [Candidatus Limnocylindria bacterium]|nr:HAMP domain-containing sensor histidine kinase [Candidatus Limnocylindria bacterium]